MGNTITLEQIWSLSPKDLNTYLRSYRVQPGSNYERNRAHLARLCYHDKTLRIQDHVYIEWPGFGSLRGPLGIQDLIRPFVEKLWLLNRTFNMTVDLACDLAQGHGSYTEQFARNWSGNRFRTSLNNFIVGIVIMWQHNRRYWERIVADACQRLLKERVYYENNYISSDVATIITHEVWRAKLQLECKDIDTISKVFAAKNHSKILIWSQASFDPARIMAGLLNVHLNALPKAVQWYYLVVIYDLLTYLPRYAYLHDRWAAYVINTAKRTGINEKDIFAHMSGQSLPPEAGYLNRHFGEHHLGLIVASYLAQPPTRHQCITNILNHPACWDDKFI